MQRRWLNRVDKIMSDIHDERIRHLKNKTIYWSERNYWFTRQFCERLNNTLELRAMASYFKEKSKKKKIVRPSTSDIEAAKTIVSTFD